MDLEAVFNSNLATTTKYSSHQRRVPFFLTFTFLFVISIFFLFVVVLSTSEPRPQLARPQELEPPDVSSNINTNVTPRFDALDVLASVRGPPTMSLHDNLRNDTKYITSWLSAGWTNDVMTYGNLIYLALITERIPIVGRFTGSPNIGLDIEPIRFGDIFDLPRLRKSLGVPIVEWDDIKDPSSRHVDEIGCWSIWLAVQDKEPQPRHCPITEVLKLDISYTPAPARIRMDGLHSSFWSLATLAFSETREANLQPPLPSPHHKVSLPPDDHLLCYDYMYYVGAHSAFEYNHDYSPAWRFVLKHMRWTERVEKLAETYVRRALGVPHSDPIPHYITIHMRRDDFGLNCGVPVHECFANFSVISRRVKEVQDELRSSRGIIAKHVIMTSDEKDSAWWSDVVAQGWFRLDHSMTVETYGRWYPAVIDVAIQSNGVGFVGTHGSTMSLIAGRRVESWHNGVSRTVNWGRLDADDH